jgi:hypothetical protein
MGLPKFIITMDGYFRLGMVNQHKDLLKPGDSCLGGGYYHRLAGRHDCQLRRILYFRMPRDNYDK